MRHAIPPSPRALRVLRGLVLVGAAGAGIYTARPQHSWAVEPDGRLGGGVGPVLGVVAPPAAFIANGQLAERGPIGVLYEVGGGTACTGTQVERAECILSAAHCKDKTTWTAHRPGESQPGLPISNPRVSASIQSVDPLGPGTDASPAQQAQDIAIFRRAQNPGLPGDFYQLDLRPPKQPYQEGRVWRAYGRGLTETGADSSARIREALIAESILYTDSPGTGSAVAFGDGNGAYYDMVSWDNGDGALDSVCGGDSGGPVFVGTGIRGTISGGTDDSFGSWLTGMTCGSATSNQVVATSLNGNGDFLARAIAEECCVCIPPERSPFCHYEGPNDDGEHVLACWNGAACNEAGARATDPDGKVMPLCHHPDCFDPQTGAVFEVPRIEACGTGGGNPPAPPDDPVPPPPPPDPKPPHDGGGHGT